LCNFRTISSSKIGSKNTKIHTPQSRFQCGFQKSCFLHFTIINSDPKNPFSPRILHAEQVPVQYATNQVSINRQLPTINHQPITTRNQRQAYRKSISIAMVGYRHTRQSNAVFRPLNCQQIDDPLLMHNSG
jgi:hypothetical protein